MARQAKDAAKKNTLSPTERREASRLYCETLDVLDAEREKLNAKYRSARDALKAKGINVAAVNAARSFIQSSDTAKEEWDNDYAYAREALGEPIQQNLFTEDQAPEATDPNKPPKGGKAKAEAKPPKPGAKAESAKEPAASASSNVTNIGDAKKVQLHGKPVEPDAAGQPQ